MSDPWHRLKDWADIILHFAKENGLEYNVMTVEEIRIGIESRGTVLCFPTTHTINKQVDE
ncbi:putative ESCRT-II complex, Vps25 subunit, winged helix-like DNA-binding domain superfamily [Helianthus anomalus]